MPLNKNEQITPGGLDIVRYNGLGMGMKLEMFLFTEYKIAATIYILN